MERRTLLKSFAFGIVPEIVTGFPHLKKVLSGTRREKPISPEKERNWTLEEIVQEPLVFIDDVIVRIKNNPNKYKDPYYLQIEMLFGKKTAYSMENRSSLTKGMELYGQRILNLYNRVAKLESNPEQYSSYGLFSRVKSALYPLEMLRKVMVEDANPMFFRLEDLNNLSALANRFRLLNQHANFIDQKKSYEKNAQTLWIREKIDQIWNNAIKLKLGFNKTVDDSENSRARTHEAKKLFLKIAEVTSKYFPTAISGFDSIDFTGKKGGRAYYQDNRGIFLGQEFEKVINSYEQHKITNYPFYQWQIVSLIDQFCVVLLHECGHGRDLNDKNSPLMWDAHPELFLDFAESRIQVLEKFQEFIKSDKLDPKDLISWFMDPLSPKNFGVDQIISSGQLNGFKNECAMMKRTWATFYNLPPKLSDDLWVESQIGEIINMPQEFELATMLLQGPSRNGQTEPYITTFGKIQAGEIPDCAPISKINKIAPSIFDEMSDLASQIWSSKHLSDGEKQDAFSALLRIKSFMLFSSYAFFERANIDPNYSSEFAQLEYGRQEFQRHIFGHLLHTQVGPYGEYAPENITLSLLEGSSQQMETAIVQAIIQRGSMIDGYTFDSSIFRPNLVNYLEELNRDLIRDQYIMAKLWGADIAGPETVGDYYQSYVLDVLKCFDIDVAQLFDTGDSARG